MAVHKLLVNSGVRMRARTAQLCLPSPNNDNNSLLNFIKTQYTKVLHVNKICIHNINLNTNYS